MSKKYTIQEIKDYLKIFNCKLLIEEYKDVFSKLKIECSCKNIFYRGFKDFKSSGGTCNICTQKNTNNKTKLDKNIVKSTINKMGYELKSLDYINANSKIEIESYEGYKYKVVYGSLQQSHIPDAFSITNPFSIYNINIWTEKNIKPFLLISYKFLGSNSKLTWACKICGENWDATWSSIYSSKSGCPYCVNQKVSKNNNLSITHPNLLEEWHYTKNKKSPNLYTHGSDSIVWWECNTCRFEWKARIANRTNGRNCPNCMLSKGELKIYEYLKKNNINFEQQYEFNDLLSELGNPLKFDFVIFNNNDNISCLIEFDGIQHFKPVDYFGGEKGFMAQQISDESKNEYCKNNNIKLKRISYLEFDNIEEILTYLIKECNMPWIK